MKCSICASASAQLHTVTIDGKQCEVCLCNACYQKRYSKTKGAPQDINKVCPTCALTLEAFQKSGLVGCAGCYTAFRDEIKVSVSYCQRGSRHCGKSPLGAPQIKYDLLREQDSLISRLNIARQEGNQRLNQELSRRLADLKKLIARAENVQQRLRTEAEHKELHAEDDDGLHAEEDD